MSKRSTFYVRVLYNMLILSQNTNTANRTTKINIYYYTIIYSMIGTPNKLVWASSGPPKKHQNRLKKKSPEPRCTVRPRYLAPAPGLEVPRARSAERRPKAQPCSDSPPVRKVALGLTLIWRFLKISNDIYIYIWEFRTVWVFSGTSTCWIMLGSSIIILMWLNV